MSKVYTTAQFLQAIPKSGGVVSVIAQRVGCAWNTARSFIDRHPTVLQAYNDEQNRLLDMAESKLIDSMNNGNMDDVKWFLAKKGKQRGYGEQVDQKHSGELAIRFIDTDGND